MKTAMSTKNTRTYADQVNPIYNNTGSILMPQSLCLDFSEKFQPRNNNDFSTNRLLYRDIGF